MPDEVETTDVWTNLVSDANETEGEEGEESATDDAAETVKEAVSYPFQWLFGKPRK